MRVKDVWRIESLNIEFETIYIYAENSTHAIFTSGDRISNLWLRIDKPTILRFATTIGRFYDFCYNTLGINHDTIQKKRQGHFERLKNEVLQKCVDKPAYLAIDKKGFSRSLIELYVNIFDVLKAYNRFPRVRLHFEHEDYKETKVLLDEIENRSIEHNKKISEFM
jgi:hypothetical protein